MPNDSAQLIVALATLILLAVTLGTLSARLFLSAAGAPTSAPPRARGRTDGDATAPSGGAEAE
jgi:hypothetical protein